MLSGRNPHWRGPTQQRLKRVRQVERAGKQNTCPRDLPGTGDTTHFPHSANQFEINRHPETLFHGPGSRALRPHRNIARACQGADLSVARCQNHEEGVPTPDVDVVSGNAGANYPIVPDRSFLGTRLLGH